MKNIPNILTVCLQTQPHVPFFAFSARFKPPTFNEVSDEGELSCACWIVELRFLLKQNPGKANVLYL